MNGPLLLPPDVPVHPVVLVLWSGRGEVGEEVEVIPGEEGVALVLEGLVQRGRGVVAQTEKVEFWKEGQILCNWV